jgi:hypothetical protein
MEKLGTHIQRLKEEYNTGVRNVDDYWEATATLLLPFCKRKCLKE